MKITPREKRRHACRLFLRARVSLALLSLRKNDILGDPGADSGGEGKSKRAEKYGTKKSKERREEPLGQCLTRQVPDGRRRSGF